MTLHQSPFLSCKKRDFFHSESLGVVLENHTHSHNLSDGLILIWALPFM